MLYTPLLAEVAAGAIEPRHSVVPLRMMCPDAEFVLGRATGLDEARRCVSVETEGGTVEIEYERLVLALGAITRIAPIPGLERHAIGFKSIGDAIHLRNHVLHRLDLAEADPGNAKRHLSFVFVGAGYAGIEALAEVADMVGDALGGYPSLRDVPQRWVLVDGGRRVLSAAPERLGLYAADQLRRRGTEIRLSTRLSAVDGQGVTLADGSRIEAGTVVWTAGIEPHPLADAFGLPVDESGRVKVDSHLRVEGRRDVWALGDCARVPNASTPGAFDPPTCQHALRQARQLAANLHGAARPYRFRRLGEVATLGRDGGVADMMGVKFRGRPAAVFTRVVHVRLLPLRSRRLRVVADGVLSMAFRRDMTQLGPLHGSIAAAQAARGPA
jgi:NADH dehydrogenase